MDLQYTQIQTEQELIETLWNVNETGRNEVIEDMTELIETLWNVNVNEAGAEMRALTGINRNIVECKLISISIL